MAKLKMVIIKKYDKSGKIIDKDVIRAVWASEMSARIWVIDTIPLVKGEMPVSDYWVFDTVILMKFDDVPDVYGNEHEASRSYEIVDCGFADEDSLQDETESDE